MVGASYSKRQMIESIHCFVGLLIFRSKELREAIISDIKITFVIIYIFARRNDVCYIDSKLFLM
jgi:hypothetical protein